VCDECGAITDVCVDGADQLAIDGLAAFRPDAASIVFRGSCRSCAQP
jgi:Fe2+ or Zn2+ uptake regulation protein